MKNKKNTTLSEQFQNQIS